MILMSRITFYVKTCYFLKFWFYVRDKSSFVGYLKQKLTLYKNRGGIIELTTK